jgi:MFS transporter, ACS family, solute carrier family 17 (sodium-dependent inorganic phosphate cotransporter), other
MFVCSNISGVIADNYIERGYATTHVRKGMQTLGFAGPSIFLFMLMFAPSGYVAVACLALGLGLSSFSQAGLYCMHVDIAGKTKCAGTLLGISNTFASVIGGVGVGVTGWILDATSENWNVIWALIISTYIIGWVVFTTWANSDRVF